MVLSIAGFIEQNGPNYDVAEHGSLRRVLQHATGLDFPPVQPAYANVFRNYKRLLAAFDLATVDQGQLRLLPTGQWIADTDPPDTEFFWRIVDSFQYPNPAFQNYDDWVASGRALTPMRLIVRCLRALSLARAGDHLTPREIAVALYNADDTLDDETLVLAVEAYRGHGTSPAQLPPFNPADDDVRQVREILSFLVNAGILVSAGQTITHTTQFRLAAAHRAHRPIALPVVPAPPPLNENFAAVEGAVFQENRRSRRRDPQLRVEALRRYGYVCAVCNIDYAELGDIGRAAVDVHHLHPIADRLGNEVTTLNDVRVVCATCHRLMHAGGQLRSPDELRELIQRLRR